MVVGFSPGWCGSQTGGVIGRARYPSGKMSKLDLDELLNTDEIDRIRRVYFNRDHSLSMGKHYPPDDAAYRFALQNRQRDTLKLLNKIGVTSLKNLSILDVGSGYGTVMLEYSSLGANQDSLFGCDLMFNRLKQSKGLIQRLNISCADGQNLPFPKSSFNLVSQYTVLSSVLEKSVKTNIANEMKRVLKPEGIILWYDFWLNPTNPHTRGIKPSEIRELFPGSRYIIYKTTLAPPLTRRLIHISRKACILLERIKIFNSHYLAAIIP